ncbi:MAG: ABC-F family ATP-binding cassette domain-containing protein [Pacificimonas sp.]
MLTLSDITVRLGGRTIIDKAALSVPPGGRLGLIGRNGAGKSTLMKVMIGEIEPDDGNLNLPTGARLGYLQQEAPHGTKSPLTTVLAADTERAQLLADSESVTDPDRLGDIHERLLAIDAWSAEARAARILVGLGFDEEMQARPLDSFSGGWKMRVALAALLFTRPDVLLLDEPSNHLDLEATLWLEDFLRAYPSTVVVISHERDLLNKVVTHIAHVEAGGVTLYTGGYDAFEKQRRERLDQLAATAQKQQAQRDKLQAFVDRWRTKAHSAKQAQSRLKALQRMKPVAAAVEDPTLSFDFPSPKELKPPLITLDTASTGYGDTTILNRLNLRIDPDDRIALLGRNGNGKTTLARLLAAQLPAMTGEVNASGKMEVGYFTQYQVEELDTDDTPLEHMTRQMASGSASPKPGAVRAQLGRFGFSGERALQKVETLSGGERARLALALITRDAPHLLILDEPTNHLDVDTREALVQALNDYDGAVIIVSHDRHMVEAAADRLVLVEGGTAQPYDGSLDDYTAFVLGQSGATSDKKPAAKARKKDRKAAAEQRNAEKAIRLEIKDLEAEAAALEKRVATFDKALQDPALQADSKATADVMKQRSDAADDLEAVEAQWTAKAEDLAKLETAAA